MVKYSPYDENAALQVHLTRLHIASRLLAAIVSSSPHMTTPPTVTPAMIAASLKGADELMRATER